MSSPQAVEATLDPAAAAVLATTPDRTRDERQRTARRVFQASVFVACALTAIWLFFVLTQRDAKALLGNYNVNAETIGRILFGFLFFSVLWGWIWYGVRRLLLRRWAGFSQEELRLTFSSRLKEPFDVSTFLAGHSERRIRIIDMIGRRGRFATIGLTGFWFIYSRVSAQPEANFLTLGLMDSFFEAMVFGWVAIALYGSSGFLGRVFYGAQSRLMDGQLARANCLLITTLWNLFKFVMVPISIQLVAHFPPSTFATLFVLIWGSYLLADASSEIVGSLFGKQRLRVWGIGDVNRKSVAGTWACFVSSLALCVWVIAANGLPAPWYGLAVAISVSNTFLELLSPRGTDDFTMATANALLCWAFGVLLY